MRGLFRACRNDGLRSLIGFVIDMLGFTFERIHRIRVAMFEYSQRRLRRRYRITDTPVLTYGLSTEQHVRDAARRYDKVTYAQTSGSTGSPKRILYTKRRLRSVRWTFIDFFARCYRAYGIRRKSLYVFSAFGHDNSLTSMLLEEKRLPSYLVTLQAPYRVEKHYAIQDLSRRYGTTAVRLWILTIANPGVLYSTNPSTLWLFLHEITTDWQKSRKLVQDFRNSPETFSTEIHNVAMRLESIGSDERVARIAGADEPLPLSVFAPAVGGYVCWTGGYVKPFLDRIAAHLPPDRYRLIPMYSMSTETIETIGHFDRSSTAFLPMSKGVLYEFIEEGAPDTPSSLVTPDKLRPEKSYTMVVSDAYGLRRYQTEDLFTCTGFAGKLPDLRFLRRRNLEFSFTGEKVSAGQLQLVFERLRAESAVLPSDALLACVPSDPQGEPPPYYTVMLACDSDLHSPIAGNVIASRCDTLLEEVNAEYRDKRRSGRLAPMRFVRLAFSDFTAHQNNQFKFLPLFPESPCVLREQRILWKFG